MSIHVSHRPPGTSKWNKVEHRLFSFISINWRGRPLRTNETVINLIGNTTNRGGLVVHVRLDRRRYHTGKKISKKELRDLKVECEEFHGEWNYVIRSRRNSVDRSTSPFPVPKASGATAPGAGAVPRRPGGAQRLPDRRARRPHNNLPHPGASPPGGTSRGQSAGCRSPNTRCCLPQDRGRCRV